ncbi:FecR family protein [Bacteroides sp. UBA939]|uniref:FecR family protein n=1 Tax=Bacteroides sp. UBA939 TaxID=1946092 RepID=UPI0025C03F6A|nr:FecR family protein [Bacteroides sp. UBA939]
MEENNKEENVYEKLASYLDDCFASTDEKPFRSEEEKEEFQKLMFIWDECHPEKVETEGIWNKTLQKIKKNDAPNVLHPQRRSANKPAWIWGAAASVALLMGVYFFSQEKVEEEINEAQKMEQYMLANTSNDDVKEVTLVVSDKKKIELANNSQVAYSSTGQVHVNSDKLEEEAKEEKQDQAEEYNQIIVPKGRRSMIVLADNSKIWINSGSKVIYPRAFKEGKRQIYIEGEVYLKVARDEAKPFTVSTSAFEVEVLGTSFNISAYKGSSKANVVLVEGAVNVKDRQKHHIKMQPNELVELNEAGIHRKEKVNALEYINWVDGVWPLNGKTLKEVVQYLSEYYGQIIFCDPSIENEPFYGKLFLNEDLDRVLESIRQTLPETLTVKNDIIYAESNQ